MNSKAPHVVPGGAVPAFYRLTAPYCDFGMVKAEGGQASLPPLEICEDAGLRTVDLKCPDGSAGRLVTAEMPGRLGDEEFLFSGLARTENAFLCGQADITSVEILGDLADQVGTFTCWHRTKREIRFLADYYSMGRYFYFRNEQYFVVSNRYHLLLLILKDLGVPMEVDWDVVVASLCLTPGCTPMLSQHFSRKMMVKGCIRLPIDQRIIIDGAGVRMEQSAIGRDFGRQEPLSRTEYQALIRQAAREITENVRLTVENPRFRHVAVDLTSGLDSRLVYAAVTNLEQGREKIEINTGGGEEEFAIPLNHLYEFPYMVQGPERRVCIPKEQVLSQLRSYYLGLEELLINIYPEQASYPATINLAGGCGETFRPYFSINFPAKERTLPAREGAAELVRRVKGRFVLNYDTARQSLISVLAEEAEQLPGNNWGEKADNLYLYHRNSYMFNNEYMSSMNMLRWHPLQSKAMFRLRQSGMGMELAFDLLNALNPCVTNLPYNHKEYAEFLQQHEKDLLPVSPVMRGLHIPLDFDDAAFKAAVKQRGENSKKAAVVNGKAAVSRNTVLQAMREEAGKRITYLREVLGTRAEKLGLQGLERWFQDSGENMLAMRYAWSQLTSITDQLGIVAAAPTELVAASTEQVAPAEQAAPVKQAAPAEQAAPVKQAAPAKQEAPAKQASKAGKKPPMKVLFTIDTEHKRGGEPVLMTGDLRTHGIQENWGTSRIMDEFDAHGMKAVFFVNVYEAGDALPQWKTYVEDTMQEIQRRGHELGLHCHPSNCTIKSFISTGKTRLDHLDLAGQIQNIKVAMDYMEQVTGVRPISFRGGAYRISSDTFEALATCGIKYDSSCWYGSLKNILPSWPSINQVSRIKDVTEFPVVLVVSAKGRITKLDLDLFTSKQIINVFEQARKREDFPYIQLMFHSFTLLSQKPTGEYQTALLNCGNKLIYGPNEEKLKRLREVLDYLQSRPEDYEVCTFLDLDREGMRIPSMASDGIFTVPTPAAQKVAEQFSKENYYDPQVGHVVCTIENTQVLHYNENASYMPTTYFPVNKIQAFADEILNGKLWVYPAYNPLHFKLNTLDWSLRNKEYGNTFQIYLQALTPVQIVIQAFLKTKDRKYLNFAQKFIMEWAKYEADKDRSGRNISVWYDHSASLRSRIIICYGKVCKDEGYEGAEQEAWLYKLLMRHGEWLVEDANYTKEHNHGVMEDEALLMLSKVLAREDWYEIAKKRLLAQFLFAFNEERVHVENSAGYVSIVSAMFQRCAEFLQAYGDPMGDELIKELGKSKEFENWVTKPNGIIAQLGDSQNPGNTLYGTKEKQQRKSPETHKIYPKSGYYFYRSDRNAEAKNDTWKCLKSGYSTITHKHADDCSIMLYSKGYEILADCGIYGYTNDDFRKYMRSANAHNAVVVDDSSYTVELEQKDLVGLSAYEFGPTYDHVQVFNRAYEGVYYQRDFYSADDLTILHDRLVSQQSHTYSQLFHLAEDIKVLFSRDREVLLSIGSSGYVARIRQLGGAVKLSVICGDVKKAGYGLISRKVGHLAAINTLKFALTGESGEFITVITIEDKNGTVRLWDEREDAEGLRHDAQEQKIILNKWTCQLCPLNTQAQKLE